MSDEHDWVSIALTSAMRTKVSVPPGVWTEVETLLAGKLCKRPLSAIELAAIARLLLDEMAEAAENVQEQT